MERYGVVDESGARGSRPGGAGRSVIMALAAARRPPIPVPAVARRPPIPVHAVVRRPPIPVPAVLLAAVLLLAHAPLQAQRAGSAVDAPTGVRIAGICVVERVIDGDTLDCEGGVRVRLLLIDAPERRQGYALRASLALEEILPVGDSAAVELDVEPRDRYGRLLAHLHRLDGLWVNRAQVRRGYAVPLVYPPNVRHVEAIRAATDSARAEGLGVGGRAGNVSSGRFPSGEMPLKCRKPG